MLTGVWCLLQVPAFAAYKLWTAVLQPYLFTKTSQVCARFVSNNLDLVGTLPPVSAARKCTVVPEGLHVCRQ